MSSMTVLRPSPVPLRPVVEQEVVEEVLRFIKTMRPRYYPTMTSGQIAREAARHEGMITLCQHLVQLWYQSHPGVGEVIPKVHDII